jgi:carbon storage regulator
MLILSRKLNESIVIGDGIVVRILRISKDTVKIGIEAPPEMRVHREEIAQNPPPKPQPPQE